MRFKDYLNESMDSSFDEERFKKECAFYFEQMKGSKLLLLHGTDAQVVAGQKVAFRKRDKPRDSTPSLHERANEFFKEKFGKPFRDGLFVSGKQSIANEFGSHIAFIIPIGKFEWLSSPDIRDMTFINTLHASKLGQLGKSSPEAEDKTMEDVKKARWLHNEDLPKCIAGLSEVMLWCPDGFYTFTYGNLPRSVLA